MEDRLAAIRRLYYGATPATIGRDLARAVELLKAMPGEEERERATVFMEGLSDMRREWARAAAKGPKARMAAVGGGPRRGPASRRKGVR